MHKLRVLLVEDEPAFAHLAIEYLEGYDVVHVTTGKEGLRAIASEVPDVILLDLTLPDMRGLATLERYRQADLHIPIVIYTSLEDEALALASLRGGAQDYLVKGQASANALRRAILLARERPRAPSAQTVQAAVRHLEILEAEQTMLRQILQGATTMPAKAREWTPGVVMAGRYEIIEQLGAGGQGHVHLARDLVLSRQVVLKTVDAPAEDGARGFLKEARLLAALDHPGIVRVLDFGMDGASPYLVLERIQGASAEEIVRTRGPLEAHEALRLVVYVLDALAHAHANGILHRDVKPANVLVAREGIPKLIDFGLGARSVEPSGFASPAFAPPEAREGQPISTTSDQYGLAATLHYLLTGEPPKGNLDGRIPPAVRGSLSRALAPDPAARFPDLAAFRVALVDALNASDEEARSARRR